MSGSAGGTDIVTDDPGVQVTGQEAESGVDATTRPSGSVPAALTIDPRLTAVGDDAAKDSDRTSKKIKDKTKKSREDSARKTKIDEQNGGDTDKIAQLARLLSSGGGAGAGAGGGAQQPSGASTPQMPQMPTTGSATPQVNPATLSNPAQQAAIQKLLAGINGDDKALTGSGGVAGLGGPGGGGGAGSTAPGAGGRNEYERNLLKLSKEVVDAGIPYAWGGGDLNGPSQGTTDGGGAADANGDYNKQGFDCSSLVRYLLYQTSGVEIARTSQEQFNGGVEVSPSEARIGDLVFPDSAGRPPTHVQMYVGDGKVVEAQSSGTNVMFSDAPPGTYKRYVDNKDEAA